jgi:hypothetical protein
MRRTWREGSFIQVPEGYIKEGSGDITGLLFLDPEDVESV